MPLLGAGISAGTSLLSGLLGSSSASKAAAQASATDKAAALGVQNLAQSGFDATQQQLQPYLNVGTSGANQLAADSAPGGSLSQQFSFDPSQVANTPEYNFQLQQGNDAVQASAAAHGGLFSGNTLRGLTQYSQGLASTSYQQAYNNALNTFQTNRNNTLGTDLATTGVGQSAVSQYQNAVGQRLGANVSAIQPYEAAGNATAAGTIGASNAWTSALNGVSNAAQSYLNPYGTSSTNLSTTPTVSSTPQLANPYPTSASAPLPTAPTVNPVPTNWAATNWTGGAY